MNKLLIQKIILCFCCIGFNCDSIFSQEPLDSSQQFHKTNGDILLGTLPALALGSTLIWQDGQKGTEQFAKTLTSTILLTNILKFTIDKQRPNGQNNNSFPSGHTSIAFSNATFIQKRYGWKYGVPAYLLAGYVGYTRIEAKKHDGWDVFAGAALGIGMGYLFTKPFDKDRKLSVSAGSFKGNPTFGFTYRF